MLAAKRKQTHDNLEGVSELLQQNIKFIANVVFPITDLQYLKLSKLNKKQSSFKLEKRRSLNPWCPGCVAGILHLYRRNDGCCHPTPASAHLKQRDQRSGLPLFAVILQLEC